MKVDLPEPFGPVRPYRRPDENVVVTSSKRILLPKRMETFWTDITTDHCSLSAALRTGSRLSCQNATRSPPVRSPWNIPDPEKAKMHRPALQTVAPPPATGM